MDSNVQDIILSGSAGSIAGELIETGVCCLQFDKQDQNIQLMKLSAPARPLHFGAINFVHVSLIPGADGGVVLAHPTLKFETVVGIGLPAVKSP